MPIQYADRPFRYPNATAATPSNTKAASEKTEVATVASRSGTPTKTPPAVRGPYVFVLRPRPAANDPRTTNVAKNGMTNHWGGRSFAVFGDAG
jgi:hypothetical protein